MTNPDLPLRARVVSASQLIWRSVRLLLRRRNERG